MTKDLTTSAIDRQNILNNPMALPKIQEALDVKFYEFHGRYVVTKQMVAEYYDVEERTIERIIKANEEEIRNNGYNVLKGEELKEFRSRYVGDINVAHKAVNLFLDLAAGCMDKELLIDIMHCLVNSEPYSESILLGIMNAREARINIEQQFEE